MTYKEFTNKILNSMEKCFDAMDKHEPYSEQFTKSLENLNRLYMWRPGSLFEDDPYNQIEIGNVEPYVEEPPHDTEWVKDEPVEAEEPDVDYKKLRTDLQKRLSRARTEKGINPKDLVKKYAESYKSVADEDLPSLSNDLEEAIANA